MTAGNSDDAIANTDDDGDSTGDDADSTGDDADNTGDDVDSIGDDVANTDYYRELGPDLDIGQNQLKLFPEKRKSIVIGLSDGV